MMYNNGKTSKELYAVLDENKEVVWSRGGSSTAPKLMVYETAQKAERAVKNAWTQQVHSASVLEIHKIYSSL